MHGILSQNDPYIRNQSIVDILGCTAQRRPRSRAVIPSSMHVLSRRKRSILADLPCLRLFSSSMLLSRRLPIRRHLITSLSVPSIPPRFCPATYARTLRQRHRRAHVVIVACRRAARPVDIVERRFVAMNYQAL
jgi:hypothetical protein